MENRYITNKYQDAISSNNNDIGKYYINPKDNYPNIKKIYKILKNDIFYNRVSKMNDKQWEKFVEYWGELKRNINVPDIV